MSKVSALLPTDRGAAALPPPDHRSTVRALLGGTSVLAVATVLERGLGFMGGFLAARLAGPAVFGSYSLAVTTAMSIASYTGSGIGTTATRFASQYGRDSVQYRPMVRAVLRVVAVSASLAALLLMLGAGPIARLVLEKEGLVTLLRVAAVTAAAVLILECFRGFLVGARRYQAQVVLGLLLGIGLLVVLPVASRVSPLAMVAGQASVVFGAVAVCLLLAGPLGLRALPSVPPGEPTQALGREVWTFGMVQLTSLLGVNAAGWWLTLMVARADASMVQVGLLALSQQVRNMVSMIPGLLSQSGYSLVVGSGGNSRSDSDDPRQAMALCLFLATFASLALAGPAFLVLPWLLPWAYGSRYAAGVLPVALGLATAVVHMGNAPAAARLTAVSVRATGSVNLAWAVLTAILATVLVPHGGALPASFTYFAAHLCSAGLVLLALAREGLSQGVLATSFLGGGATISLTALAWWRESHPEQADGTTVGMAVLLVAALGLLWRLGSQHHWLPAPSQVASLLMKARSRVQLLGKQ